MRVLTLNINNLRNITSARIEPGPGLNCIVGDNGAGKTSILEAMAVLSKGRSFRPGHLTSLIGPESVKGTGSYYLEEGPEGEEAARNQAATMIVEGILNLVVEEW